ncbi:MAG: hypothetical protein IIV90_03245, partial [Oscillospiraceae bacterium]|nr:hypothetical protein [Oscillospiraceae bacterium]
EIRRGLDFDSEAEAKARMKALAQKKGELEEELKALRKGLEAARQARDTTAGSLGEKKDLLAERTAALAGEEKALDQAVAKAGFAGRKEADAALALIPRDKDGEAWLAEEEAARSGYENALSGTAARISELEKLTAGRPRADMAALEESLAAAAESWQKANAQWAGQNALLENHRRTAAAAHECLAGLEASRPAWQRLEKLGSLAAGAAGAGGKLSFDRYVMGAVFREVLEMANRRLDIMSGGKYELIHKTDAERKNAKAGLEIEVLDISTGRQRPSGTLSGGEAFFTSLALALGLSDVVQNHAGGKKLDALFIDEGFGTLSDGVLDKALEVLNQLTEGDRLVGIISHVDKLDESIPQKIRVRHTEKGSSLSVEVG